MIWLRSNIYVNASPLFNSKLTLLLYFINPKCFFQLQNFICLKKLDIIFSKLTSYPHTVTSFLPPKAKKEFTKFLKKVCIVLILEDISLLTFIYINRYCYLYPSDEMLKFYSTATMQYIHMKLEGLNSSTQLPLCSIYT